MTFKTGVSMSDDLAEEVNEPLTYGDSRSERIVELIERGLVLEELCEEFGRPLPDERREARRALRQVFLDAERD